MVFKNFFSNTITLKHPLHILFLAHWYPSRVHTTAGNFVQRHAETVATKHRVTVVFAISDKTLTKPYEIAENIIAGVNTIIVYFSPGKHKITNAFKKIKAYRLGLNRVSAFDVIHLNVLHYYGVIALYYKLRKNIPYVITEHWTLWNDDSISQKEQFVAKLVARRASILLPVCSFLGNNMRIVGNNIPQQTIPNVFDPQIFHLKAKEKSEKFIFLHISSLLDNHKNISGILKVSRRLALENDCFELHIGGDGDINQILQFREKNHLENVIKTFGQLTPNEVAQKMTSSDTFILFSNKENQPCVINEAFACGLPVIATKVGGITEFFPGEFGILIDKEDENSLYLAMKKCLSGTQFAPSQFIADYALEHFGTNAIAEAFDKVYSSAIAAKKQE
jgi:glycosyltransferase involved in cell wall biosynthesis